MILLALFTALCYHNTPQPSLPIAAKEMSTLAFHEEILDVELASPHYHVKVKGCFLLLRAKNLHVPPTSIFVRYGKHKRAFTAHIFPKEGAPLMHSITEDDPNRGEPSPQWYLASPAQQRYFDLGTRSQGLRLILTDILQGKGNTWIQLFLYNHSSLAFSIDQIALTYTSRLRSSLFRSNTSEKPINPIAAPEDFCLPPYKGAYLVLNIPAWASSGGIQIRIEEQHGERMLQLRVPAAYLLRAPTW